MKQTVRSRREFVKKTVSGSAVLLAGGAMSQLSAKDYRRVPGANERINVSVMGVNSRGKALAQNFAYQPNAEVVHLCDVDTRALDSCTASLNNVQERVPRHFGDFRESLEDPDVDVMVVATPDHWHAPAALLAMQAGKHVYLEKPCSHSPAEGAMLVEGAKKTGKVLQMGNQRRSWPNVIAGIRALKDGIIGRCYFGKSWYTNNRGPIGHGDKVDVPSWLNWDLWQGPAPRQDYRDNIVHYNWHWFWHWGTGEALNNGTHMVDLLRWGFGLDYPVRVSSNGGRYRYQDDWETPDTQVITLDFVEGITMTWEGRSCNGKTIAGHSVGAVFFGEKGSLMIPGGDSYTVYDLDGNVIEEVKAGKNIDPRDAANPSSHLDSKHIQNFFNGILGKEKLNADIDSGHKSTLLVQLGNISQRVGRSLDIDPETGHITGDAGANRYWARDYEQGWEMKL